MTGCGPPTIQTTAPARLDFNHQKTALNTVLFGHHQIEFSRSDITRQHTFPRLVPLSAKPADPIDDTDPANGL